MFCDLAFPWSVLSFGRYQFQQLDDITPTPAPSGQRPGSTLSSRTLPTAIPIPGDRGKQGLMAVFFCMYKGKRSLFQAHKDGIAHLDLSKG
jgi:hypothetical protein